MVYTQSEELELAEEPIEENVCGPKIELDGVVSDLEAGRLVIVSGERSIKGTSGVWGSDFAWMANSAGV